MTLAMFFWLLFVLWIVCSMLWWTTAPTAPSPWPHWAAWTIVTGMLFTLGWGVFGFIVRGG